MQIKIINPANNVRQRNYFDYKVIRGVSGFTDRTLLTVRYGDHIELGYGYGVGCRLILCKKSITIFRV